MARALFSDEAQQREFLDAIQRREAGATGVVWLNEPVKKRLLATGVRPDWLPQWIDVSAHGERPGKSDEHEHGEIYCMDLSSTFACAVLSEIKTPVRIVVDVCASPGGKGILARRYLDPALLVGNEVIGKRTAQLISNYKRCRIAPSVVTSLDPEILGEELAGCGDLVIVDAPCSGQSLLLKGMAAPGAFHPATIGMNERRQRRILAHSASSVAPGGYLLYSTCTFSREENEDNLEWFLKKFNGFSAVPVELLCAYQSHLSREPCYRLWPHMGKGAGAFSALLRRSDPEGRGSPSSPDALVTKLRGAWRSPVRFVSGDERPHQRAKRNASRRAKGADKRRVERSERQKAKRALRDFT